MLMGMRWLIEPTLADVTAQLLATQGAGCARIELDAHNHPGDPICAQLRLRGYDAWWDTEIVGLYSVGWFVYAALQGRREAVEAIGRFARKFGA